MNKDVADVVNGASKISRRKFLKSSVQSVAVLTLAFNLPVNKTRAASGALPGGGLTPNAWLTINSDNTVTILSSAAEMGQGSFTSLPLIIAEELELAPAQVIIEHAPAGKEYANRYIQLQVTGGSSSVRWAFNPMRQLGADVREMFKNAAAKVWETNASELRAQEAVIHHPDGRQATYAELAELTKGMDLPSGTPLKPRSEWRILGTDFKRKDLPEKIAGTAEFGIDVQIDDMLIATVKACPTFGGKLVSVDMAPALAVKGVKEVVKLGDAVAVCATNYWSAKKGLDALSPVWDLGSNVEVSTSGIRKLMLDDLDKPGIVALSNGSMNEVLSQAESSHSALYEAPYLAHATMEPMNATADIRDGKARIWVPSQGIGIVKHVVANVLQIPESNVDVQCTFMGGGFGRRSSPDFAVQAALISQQVKSPVKLLWSREEDMKHDLYRPMTISRMEAHLDEKGKAIGLDIRSSCQSITRSLRNPAAKEDRTISEGLADAGYLFDSSRMDYRMTDVSIPVGYWRSVGHSQNSWIMESFVDELAELEGVDPYEWRLERLASDNRKKEVLEKCARESNWGNPAKGRTQGLAIAHSFGSTVAQVVEASISENGKIKIDKITCVVDCGVAINPDSVIAQMESSIVYGLTAAMYGQITIKGGAAVEANFPQYEMMRLRHMPVVDVHIVEDFDSQPGGIGEPGLPPIAPALCNAIYAATGKRVRKLPLSSQGFNFS